MKVYVASEVGWDYSKVMGVYRSLEAASALPNPISGRRLLLTSDTPTMWSTSDGTYQVEVFEVKS